MYVADLWARLLQGHAGPVLLLTFLLVGLQRLWGQRHRLKTLHPSAEEHWLGYGVLLLGMGVFAIGWSAMPTLWILMLGSWGVLLGIALMSWGVEVLRLCPLAIGLIALGLIPVPRTLVEILRTEFLPGWPEQGSAWLAYWGMQLIGQPVTLEGKILRLPNGGVSVEAGCTALVTAAQLALSNGLAGLWLHLRHRTIVLLMLCGIGLAIALNTPRIMLMLMATTYWGKDAFEFWHRGWGSQLFVMGIFTINYCLLVAWEKRERTATGKR
jgi:exosortase/archaeosortase family protein